MKKTVMFVFVIASICPAQGINISGTVVDTDGAPVADAGVSLKTGGLKTTTDAQGNFALVKNTSANPGKNAVLPHGLSASLRNGWLHLQLNQKSPVTVRSFSLRGKLLSVLQQNLNKGRHTIPLVKKNAGVFLYGVQSEQGEALLKDHSIIGAGMASTNPLPGPPSLGKQSVATDVLIVAKKGYQEYQMTLTTTDTSGIEIVLQTERQKFSFFVTSLKAMQKLSGSQDGFGGDLRFGETGPGAGLKGADKICATIAESSMKGSSAKGWRAFLSAAKGEDGKQVNAIDRIGEGPWYDRLGRVVAMKKADLLHERPQGADPLIKDDLPNEEGLPNSDPDLTGEVDNHHFLTGSNKNGELYENSRYPSTTCYDWTSSEPTKGVRPRIGFSFSIGGRVHWISGQDEGGCGASTNVDWGGGSDPDNPVVGSGGGYGGIYCFALNP